MTSEKQTIADSKKLKIKFFLVLLLFSTVSPINSLAISNSFNETSSLTLSDYSLDFATFFGGKSDDVIRDIAVDNEGSIYAVGYSYSSNFPLYNAVNTTVPSGNPSAFVIKFDQNGHLLFSILFGGSGYDIANGLVIDQDLNVYIVGTTYSTNFPVLNAYQNTNYGNSSIFVTKFDSSGQMLFSSYLGGSGYDSGYDIALDKANNVYVTGYSDSLDFNTKYPFQSTKGDFYDVVLAKFSSMGELLFSTYYGGDNIDEAYGIQVDESGNSYISGTTLSSNLPLLGNSYLTNIQGNQDIFYAIFDTTGNLTYATYFGGTDYDTSYALEVDSSHNVYLTGYTRSTNLPTTGNAYNPTYSSLNDIYLTKFLPDHSLGYSTYLGGDGNEVAYKMFLDSSGNIFIAGLTGSTNFPVVNAFNNTYSASSDSIIVKFTSDFNLEYSTYYGGIGADSFQSIALDSIGNLIVGGYSNSVDMFTKNAYYTKIAGNIDCFLAKFTDLNNPTSQFSSIQSVTTQSTNGDTTNNSLGSEDILSNPFFQGILGLAIVSVLLNVLFLFKRRKK